MVGPRLQERILDLRRGGAVDILAPALALLPAKIKLSAPAAVCALED